MIKLAKDTLSVRHVALVEPLKGLGVSCHLISGLTSSIRKFSVYFQYT